MILDTNALSAFFAGEAGAVEKLASAEVVYLPVIVLGEFRYGLAGSRKRKEWEPRLLEFTGSCTVLPVRETTTLPYARIREQLRKNGTPIPENDIWIAALALEYGQPILSRDSHFDQVRQIQRLGF